MKTEKEITFKDLVDLALRSTELDFLEAGRTVAELEEDEAYQSFRLAFQNELHNFLESQKRLEAKGEGLLGRPCKADSEEEAFARRLSHFFFESAAETYLEVKALAEDPEYWKECYEDLGEPYDLKYQLKESLCEIATHIQLANLFNRIADLGLQEAI